MCRPPTRRDLPTLPSVLARQIAYHTRILLRTPRAVVGGMLLPVLLLLLRDHGAHAARADRVQLVAGLVVFGALSTAYMTHTSGLVAAREAGVLKRWRATPVPAWCYLAGRMAATTVLAAVGGVVTALVGSAVDGTDLTAADTIGLLAVLILGAATWACLGTLASAVIPSVEASYPVLAVTYLPVVFLSGSFGAIGGLPRWLATIVNALPARPMIDGASRLLGGGSTWMTAHEAVILFAWAGGGLLLAQRRFRWVPRTSGRRRAPRAAAP